MRAKLFLQYLCTGIGALVLLGGIVAAFIFGMELLKRALGGWVSWLPAVAILGPIVWCAWGLATDEAKRAGSGKA